MIVRPRPLAQLVSPEQLEKLSTGTPEERLATIGAIPPANLGPVLAALTPKMLEGLPDLQKLAEKARQAEMSRQQIVLRSRHHAAQPQHPAHGRAATCRAAGHRG